MQVGDSFVLNVLEEGNYQALMKHFLSALLPVLIGLLELKPNQPRTVAQF